MQSHTYTVSVRGGTGAVSPAASVISGDEEEIVNVTVDASSSLTETIGVDVSQIQSFYMLADKDVEVTAGGSPFTLPANSLIWWNVNQLGVCPLSGDISTIIFDNTANDTPANVKAAFLLNSV